MLSHFSCCEIQRDDDYRKKPYQIDLSSIAQKKLFRSESSESQSAIVIRISFETHTERIEFGNLWRLFGVSASPRKWKFKPVVIIGIDRGSLDNGNSLDPLYFHFQRQKRRRKFDGESLSLSHTPSSA